MGVFVVLATVASFSKSQESSCFPTYKDKFLVLVVTLAINRNQIVSELTFTQPVFIWLLLQHIKASAIASHLYIVHVQYGIWCLNTYSQHHSLSLSDSQYNQEPSWTIIWCYQCGFKSNWIFFHSCYSLLLCLTKRNGEASNTHSRTIPCSLSTMNNQILPIG